ncbi:MAG: hypothetical protein WCP79_03040 [Bacillota bacterium]
MILVTGVCGLTGKFLYRELKDQYKENKYRYFVRKSSDVTFIAPGVKTYMLAN